MSTVCLFILLLIKAHYLPITKWKHNYKEKAYTIDLSECSGTKERDEESVCIMRNTNQRQTFNNEAVDCRR